MSILKYFKISNVIYPTEDDSQVPTSSTSGNTECYLPVSVQPATSQSLTSRESEEIQKQLDKMGQSGKKRRKYRCWKPEDRAKIGKYGHLHGNKQAIVKYQSEFPDIMHQSVTDFIKAYVEEKKKSKGAEVTELKKKKQGRPTLLPEELMKKTIDMVLNLRLKGVPAHASVINAVAKGIVLANDRSLLVENGGCISLNDDGREKYFTKWNCKGKKWCVA